VFIEVWPIRLDASGQEFPMRPSLHNVPAGQVVAKQSEEPVRVHRRVEITVEREVVSVIHQPASSFRGYCTTCGHDVLKFTAELAAATCAATPREIYRWIDEKKLHFEESPTGQVFICSESLKALTLPNKIPPHKSL
jgi:hypothetical protein